MGNTPPPLRRPQALIPARQGSLSVQHHQTPPLAETPRPVNSRVVITAREYDILMHVVEGQTKRQIAEALHLKPATIRTYLHSVYRKARVSTRTALIWWWEQQGGESWKEETGGR
ncbi:MAG: LuxR C-terminal-related transcriptional regulator [Nitrospirota bacterium]|nr:LuxR C-terminal-related transcriptional regulator [Nitrospirota bacterium]